MKKLLVIGSNGQLGSCLKDLEHKFNYIDFSFVDKDDVDITNKEELNKFFYKNQFDYIVNCAAFTAVDKAEDEEIDAKKLNSDAVFYLGQLAKNNNIKIIHISTDYVFDGLKKIPYTETDPTNPSSIYGKTKLDGEIRLLNTCDSAIIIRTSWLYSEYGNNFVKTMLRLAETNTELNIVNDQIGSPTYAGALANAIITIISKDILQNFWVQGIYHFSENGICSWFDFAKKIFEIKQIPINVNPIPSYKYPTKATRPKYSTLDKSLIIKTFNIEILDWKENLKLMLNTI